MANQGPRPLIPPVLVNIIASELEFIVLPIRRAATDGKNAEQKLESGGPPGPVLIGKGLCMEPCQPWQPEELHNFIYIHITTTAQQEHGTKNTGPGSTEAKFRSEARRFQWNFGLGFDVWDDAKRQTGEGALFP